jgi:hypothetical protein
MVRVFDRRQIIDYAGVEVAFLQRELFESAVVMGRQALLKLGVAESETHRVEREYRQRDCDRLELQRSTGDLYSGRERIFGVDRPMQDEEVPG